MSNPDVAPRPPYRFAHDTVPPALAPLADKPRWVAWDYEWKGNKWTKPPLDPHTGGYASVSNPATWGTFAEALAAMKRYGLTGVGFVLTEDDELTGIDLDDVVNDAGLFSPIAAEVLEYAETYAELSPSGEGVRIMAFGKVPNASKNDDIGVEIYGKGRYLTITGNQIPDTPNEIRPAPNTIARVLLATAKTPNGNAAPAPGIARPRGDEAERAVDALRRIPCDDRKVWLDVGMAIKSAFGDAGFSMWFDWSMRSIKFNKADTHTVWRSITPEGGITIATMFGLAKQHGWRWRPTVDPKVVALGNVAALMRNQQAPDGKSGDQQPSEPPSQQPNKKPAPPSEDPAHWFVEPWPEAVSGAAVLNDICKLLRRYIVFPKHADEAMALWVLHAWAIDAWEISPLLIIISPTKQCGKTTLLTVLHWMTPRSELVSNATASPIFRLIEDAKPAVPTFLLDEGDSYLKPDKEDLRGIINSGWMRAGARVIRTEGEGSKRQARRFSTWAPKAIGTIKKVADTLMDRSVIVTLRRKTKREKVQRFRMRDTAEFARLRQQARRWADDHVAALRDADPAIPATLDNRPADNWRALIAIADAAGGDWAARARTAAERLSDNRSDDDPGVMLLRDIRRVFEDGKEEWLGAETLTQRLIDLPETPWAEWNRGERAISSRGVAKLLSDFQITSDDRHRPRRYLAVNFKEAWEAYLPIPPCLSG